MFPHGNWISRTMPDAEKVSVRLSNGRMDGWVASTLVPYQILIVISNLLTRSFMLWLRVFSEAPFNFTVLPSSLRRKGPASPWLGFHFVHHGPRAALTHFSG